MRGGEYGKVIPDYSAVVFDEAHQIEDVAAEYFGSQVSNYQLEDLLRDLQQLPVTDSGLNRELTRAGSRVARFSEQFWMGFREGRGEEGRAPLVPGTFARKNREGRSEATPLGEAYLGLESRLQRMETTLDAIREQPPGFGTSFDASARRALIWSSSSRRRRRYVYWLERRGRGMFLRASPIDVSTLLQEKLFGRVETVVLTSATLASAGRFDFIRRRLGLTSGEEDFESGGANADKTDELVAPSGYDYDHQAVLYLPPRMPTRAAAVGRGGGGRGLQLLQISEGAPSSFRPL